MGDNHREKWQRTNKMKYKKCVALIARRRKKNRMMGKTISHSLAISGN